MSIQAGEMVERLTTIVLQFGANAALEATISLTKRVYKQRKEGQLRKEFSQLQAEEAERKQKRGSRSDDAPSQEYTDACLKLMKKTRQTFFHQLNNNSFIKICKRQKESFQLLSNDFFCPRDPALFADIIREGVPADRFCAEGLSRVLPSILKAQGINVDNVSIRIESSGNYNTCSFQTKNIFLGKS